MIPGEEGLAVSELQPELWTLDDKTFRLYLGPIGNRKTNEPL